MEVKRGYQIPVYGLGCGGAGATTIERELAATNGVVRVYVNPATETAYIDFDPTETNAWALGRAIERTGYQAGRPVGARVTDPVCGMEIRVNQAVEAALFEGEWVYFCGRSCYAAFLDTPHRYRGW